MFSVVSHLLVKNCYRPEGNLNYHLYCKLGEHSLTDKDLRVYDLPQKFAYVDIVAGMALILVGILFTYNVIPFSMMGKCFTISLGTMLLGSTLIYKIWTNCCYMGGALTVIYNGTVSK